MRRLEAVLFMSRKPLNSRKISQLADLEDGTQARTMIGQLNKRYDQLQRSFQVKKVAGGYQLRTRPQFADWIRRQEYVPKPKTIRLSTPALGLIKITGRSEQLGRPFLYATTKEFLTEFGFNSLATLPRSKQLSGPGLPTWMDSENKDAQLTQSVPVDSNQDHLSSLLSSPKPHADPSADEAV